MLRRFFIWVGIEIVSVVTFLPDLLVAMHRYEVIVQWFSNPVTDQVIRYNVYEKHTSQNYFLGSSTSTSYTIKPATAGTHTYVATAVNVKGESPFSLPASVTVPRR